MRLIRPQLLRAELVFLRAGLREATDEANLETGRGRPARPSESPVRTRLAAGGNRIRTCMGLFLSSGHFLVFCRFFVRSWKAVLRPVAWDQVRGARGRGQGTETVAKLGGFPASVACVSQRLDA